MQSIDRYNLPIEEDSWVDCSIAVFLKTYSCQPRERCKSVTITNLRHNDSPIALSNKYDRPFLLLIHTSKLVHSLVLKHDLGVYLTSSEFLKLLILFKRSKA